MEQRLSGRRFVVDGTNLILLHGAARPELRYLLALCDQLSRSGAQLHCFFDANTRYVLESQQLEQLDAFDRIAGAALWSAHFEVVPGRTEADEWILKKAKRDGSDVISNDKFRNRAKRNRWIWKRRHPVEICDGHLSLPTLGVEIPVLPGVRNYMNDAPGDSSRETAV